ncbi:hypothetical protein MKQ70_28565 [Chitinophaga sedimenti]|nr:hypothetical protein [Chitinophaga sedimenti]MCK7558729.1 hypothetical protein [Chitinophaga sedimenti]
MLKQTQQQKLLQKLSPQQIQLMKLLQVPTAILEERIKEELEENPALEYGEDEQQPADDFSNNDTPDESSDGETDDFEPDGSENEYDNIDISEYVSEGDDEIADYKLRDDNYPDPDENRTIPIKVETSFHDYLLDQLGMLELDPRKSAIAEQIIGSIDDDGYLRREVSAIVDDLSFSQNISTDEEEIKELIKVIQNLTRPAFAARTSKNACCYSFAAVHRMIRE